MGNALSLASSQRLIIASVGASAAIAVGIAIRRRWADYRWLQTFIGGGRYAFKRSVDTEQPLGDSDDETPRALAEPPTAGPVEPLPVHGDALLDAGLRALGVLSSASRTREREAGSAIVLERVSPDEDAQDSSASHAAVDDRFDGRGSARDMGNGSKGRDAASRVRTRRKVLAYDQ